MTNPERSPEDPVESKLLPTRHEPGFVEAIGGTFYGLAKTAAELYSVFVRTLYYCWFGRREPGAVIAQMYEIGNRSLFFITVVMGFLGMILVYQAGVQTLRVLPDLSMLGATFLELLVRDLAASIGSLMLATRVGAGIAAELGSMVVTEQTDALRMCSADPIDYLIVPRFIACVVMGTVVLLASSFVAYFAGMFVAWSLLGVGVPTFINFQMVTWGDCVLGLIKCFTYGGAIAIVSGHRGLSAFGGSEGVGQATTDAVVGSLFTIIVLSFVLSSVGYFVFPP